MTDNTNLSSPLNSEPLLPGQVHIEELLSGNRDEVQEAIDNTIITKYGIEMRPSMTEIWDSLKNDLPDIK